MHRPAAALVFAATFVAAAAQAAEPCSPRPMLPQHIPAFLSQAAPVSGTSAVQPPPSSPLASELGVQADCLRWEASLTPRAEFIGTVPIGSPVAYGAAPYSPDTRIVVVPVPFGSRPSRLPADAPQEFSIQPTDGPRSFSLGAVFPPVP
jgi:hypothetical protein